VKKTLNMAELDAQTAVELPDRDLMALVTIVIGNVNILRDVEITVRNVDVAAQICAAVVAANTQLTCEIQQ
jgi:hypothetical protein